MAWSDLAPWNWGRKARVRSQAKSMALDLLERVRARYDAAQTNDDNRRHWKWADGLSANSANNPAVRQTLRDRARYEMGNNTYCKGIIQTVANNTIGKGPRLRIRTGDKAVDKKLKKYFAKWAKQVDLAAKLRTMVKGRVCDGESFATITTNMALRSPVKLDFKPFEPEICTNQWNINSFKEAAKIDGIDFDEFDNPEFYWLLPYHPGDTHFSGKENNPVKTAAANVIHLFKAERAQQKRGVPEITPALPLFAQLRRYTLAVISAAEIAAIISVYLETTGQMAPAESGSPAFSTFDLERNAGMVMPEGWKANQFHPEQPTTTYAEFKHEILNEIARCLDMPFNIAACNSSGYNYSSGKLDHKTYGVSNEIDRSDVETIVLDRLLYEWIREAALIPGLIPEDLRSHIDEWEHEWYWDEVPSADPLKDANARDVSLRNGSELLGEAWEAKGYDFEEKIEEEAERWGIDVDDLKQFILRSVYEMPGAQQAPEQTDTSPPQSKSKPTPSRKERPHATSRT